MKDRTSLGTKIGAALLAGLGVAAEVGSELHRPHGAPVVIVDHHHGAAPAPPRPYFKPEVNTPMDVAARNFEAAMNQEVLHPHMGKGRSEEHTSELQSRLDISYAVFCLKKKKK